MKLLFDENLSRKLALRLSELYPGTKHVFEVGLIGSTDAEIWSYAKEYSFVIVTTDADFFDFAANLGSPPKVIWLRRWNHPTRDAEVLLRREAIRISAFESDLQLAVLVLDK